MTTSFPRFVTAPPLPDAVKNNTFYVYALLVLVILGLVVSFVAKNVPTVGKTIDGWVARRRRAAKAQKGADLADMRQQIETLTRRLDERDAYDERHRHILTDHVGWDWQAVEAISKLRAGQPADELLLPPPPLYPPKGAA